MSDYPISCVPCRRKKIKCNKKKPCNQCLKKGIVCEFPRKFRNIDIENEHDHHAHTHEMSPIRSSSQLDSGSPLKVSRLHDEVELLRKEKLAVLHENFKLTQKYHELRSKLQSLDRSQNAERDDEHGIEIAGETTELGEKYYGPSSSNYMIEALRLKNTNQDEDLYQKSDSSSTPLNNESHPANKKRDNLDTDDMDLDGHNDIHFSKKPLPWLLGRDDKPDDNLQVIKTLICHFFDHSSYRSFISKPTLMDFVNSCDKISDREWENDDDLLLLHMVLILLVLRLTPKNYNESGLTKEPVDSIVSLHKRCSSLIKNVLYRGFTKLRHNLLNESIMTVQAYILCTEWYFIDQRYEESWSMLFHCCAVAYAIGLHVMVNMRTTNESLEEAPVKLAEMSQNNNLRDESADSGVKVEEKDDSVSDGDDEDSDVPRFKVWFALKYMCGQLCSVLGRPNPISIQVNSVVLFTSNQQNLAKLRLDSEKTQVQLKMGLSECLRLSNMMLIESFMMNFTIADVMRLDARFKEECEKLTWFVSKEYQSEHSGLSEKVDEACHMPMAVEREPAIVDLIILHINRAKLLEPFSNQFLGPEDSKYLIEAMCDSILRFLDYTVDFSKDFLLRIAPHFINEEGKLLSRTKLGKVFRIDYPFLNSFMYQGIIVIFTLLNYKAKEFIKGKSDTFLKHIAQRLNDLLQLSSHLTDQLGEDVRLWSTNILYLINKDLQHINTLLTKRDHQYQNDSGENLNLETDDLDKILGFSFKDPFWLNAENYPYYLSSPSDDEMGPLMFENTDYNKNMQPNSMGQDVLNQYNLQGQDQFSGAWNQVPPAVQQVPQPQQMSQGPPHAPQQAPRQVQSQVPAHVQFDNIQQPLPLRSRESSQILAPRINQLDQHHKHPQQSLMQNHQGIPQHGMHQQSHGMHQQQMGAQQMPGHNGSQNLTPHSGPRPSSINSQMNPCINGQVGNGVPKGVPQYNQMMDGPPAGGNPNQLPDEEEEKDRANELAYAQSSQMDNMPPGYYNTPQLGFQGPT